MIKKSITGSCIALIMLIIIFFCAEFAVRFYFSDQKFPLPFSDLQRLSLPPTSQYRLVRSKKCLPLKSFKQPELFIADMEIRSDFYREDESGLWLAMPSFKGYQQFIIPQTGQTVFDMTYQIDDNGRRTTPKTSERPKRHTIVIGCSFVFGMGLPDHETLATFLQVKNPESHSYTIGLPGWSVADVIASQEKTKMWDGIEPKEGLVLFNFSYSMHMRRFLGTLSSIGQHGGHRAYLNYDISTDKYSFGGVYSKHQRWYVHFSNLFVQSKLFKLIGFDWPRVTNVTLENYAKAILQVKENYLKLYGNKNQFVVYFEPQKKWNHLIPYLEKYKIHYLDYTDFSLSKYAQTEIFIPGDGHPTAEYNRLLAEQMTCDLKLAENKKRLNGI